MTARGTLDPAPTLSCADPAEEETAGPLTTRAQQALTLAIVLAPLAGLALAVASSWGGSLNPADVAVGVVLYLVSGFGVTVGYHRLFTHNSFKAPRWLRVSLALAGALAVEGTVTGWVATHRRHHLYSDRGGDPHSPHRYGNALPELARGLLFAHVGWLFTSDHSSAERYAPDVLRDRDLRRVDRLFPLLAIASLAAPFGIGYLVSGSLSGALSMLVWAGLVRMGLLHHVTWGVNSLCHCFGRRSEETTDLSTNLWPLALISFGESWHNVHHAHPSWARHGARPGMLDPSAWVIRLFERFGWATKVRWPRLAF